MVWSEMFHKLVVVKPKKNDNPSDMIIRIIPLKVQH